MHLYMTEVEGQLDQPRGPKARREARKKLHKEKTPKPGSSHHRKREDRASGPATMHEESGMHNKKGKGGSNTRRHGN